MGIEYLLCTDFDRKLSRNSEMWENINNRISELEEIEESDMTEEESDEYDDLCEESQRRSELDDYFTELVSLQRDLEDTIYRMNELIEYVGEIEENLLH